MRKILSSRIFRILVCLALICCFLVNSSPIKAEAVVTEGLITGSVLVPVVTAAAAILIALGVMAATDPAPFQLVVNDFATWLTNSTSYVVNGMINVLGIMYADGTVKSFVLKDMIQDGWEWAFDSGVVSSLPSSVSAGSSIVLGGITYTANSAVMPLFVRAQVGYNIKYFHFFIGGNSTFVVYDSSGGTLSTSFSDDLGVRTYYSVVNVTGLGFDVAGAYDFSQKNYSNVPSLATALISHLKSGVEVFPSDGLTLGQIQSPYQTVGTEEEIIDIEVAPIYVDWNTGKVSQKPPGSNDDDEKIHLPLSIPSIGKDLSDAVIDMSQEVAQEGTPSPDLDFDFETSTDPDPGTGEPGTGTNPGSGSDSWSPPNDMGKFTLDLKDYFPFCIPFDLYDFFTCLNAEPVAPVIEWVIPLPGGDTYPLELDLSTFDPVAQLLRRLQLLLFCVGLAFKTRDLIKG